MLLSIIRMFKKNNLSYSELYQKYYYDIYKVSFYMTKDPHISYDLVQETFYKAYQHLDSLQDPNKVKSWLCSIATRTAIDYLRKKKDICIENEAMNYTDEEPAITVEEIAENNSLREILLAELDLLDEKYKQVILLKYFAHQKDEEIADQLGVSVGTIKSRIFRAKAILKKSLIWRKEELT